MHTDTEYFLYIIYAQHYKNKILDTNPFSELPFLWQFILMHKRFVADYLYWRCIHRLALHHCTQGTFDNFIIYYVRCVCRNSYAHTFLIYVLEHTPHMHVFTWLHETICSIWWSYFSRLSRLRLTHWIWYATSQSEPLV